MNRILESIFDFLEMPILALCVILCLIDLVWVTWEFYLNVAYPQGRKCHSCCIHGCDHAPAEKMPNEKKAK
jgi:hypothetical protein